MMNKLPIILDDFIDEELQNKIEDAMFDCQWSFTNDCTFYYDTKSMGTKYRKILNPFEYDISPAIMTNILGDRYTFKLFNQIIRKTCDHIGFSIEKLSRCFAGIQGVQVIRKKSKIDHIHINDTNPHLVLLYYVNDADGETILYDKTTSDIKDEDNAMWFIDEKYEFNISQKISPKRGRILLFDGRTYHSSSSPSTGIRSIIATDIFGEFIDGSYKFPAPVESLKKNKFIYQ